MDRVKGERPERVGRQIPVVGLAGGPERQVVVDLGSTQIMRSHQLEQPDQDRCLADKRCESLGPRRPLVAPTQIDQEMHQPGRAGE